MKKIRVTYGDGRILEFDLETEDKVPVIDWETLADFGVDWESNIYDDRMKIEYQKPDGTWGDVEYER